MPPDACWSPARRRLVFVLAILTCALGVVGIESALGAFDRPVRIGASILGALSSFALAIAVWPRRPSTH